MEAIHVLHEELPIDELPALPVFPIKSDGRHERGRRRQHALIDVARDLFIQHGYRGTTLEAIIARAGGSRETIYRVFGGKRGLFGAIIEHVGKQLADSIVTPDSLELQPREALTRFGRQLVTIWQSDEGRAMNRVVVSEGLDAPELVDAWYSGGTKLSISALAHYLKSQSAAGVLAPLDGPLVARQFVTLLMGEMAFPLVAKDSMDEATKCDSAAQISHCVDLILRAYAVDDTR